MTDEPIVNSFLETDVYKAYMAQMQTLLWSDAGRTPGDRVDRVYVRWAYKNRTKGVRLTDLIDEGELREQLKHLSSIEWRPDEIDFLRDLPGFRPGFMREEFLATLPNVRIPLIDVEKRSDGQYGITCSGPWRMTTWAETPVLNVTRHLAYKRFFRDLGVDKPGTARDAYMAKADELFEIKADLLCRHPEGQIFISDFGNRRHESLGSHRRRLRRALERFGKRLTGTSNMLLARELGLKVNGSCAHEMFMCYAALLREEMGGVNATQRKMLEDWFAMYGDQLAVALTDTFGTDAFFACLTDELIRLIRWLRHDSGDPFAFGERAIGFWQERGIDPMDKGLLFSDGLDAPTIDALQTRFYGRTKLIYGWGTDLTCDFPGIKPHSEVMKIEWCNGKPTVKVSDNPAKAFGPPDEVALYKRDVGYREHEYVECVR